MSEFEDKLNAVLSDPDMMSRIMGLAQTMSAGSGSAPRPEAGSERSSGTDAAGTSDPLSLLSSIDPRFLDAAVRMMNTWQSGDDRRTALLNALRPFVREERYSRLDRAIRITRLTQAVRAAIDVLRSREGGQDHV